MFESCFTRDLDEKKGENWIGREFFSKTFLVGLKISGASTGPPPYIQIYIKKENTYLFVIGTQRERNEFVSPWDFLLSIFFFFRLCATHAARFSFIRFFLSLSLSAAFLSILYTILSRWDGWVCWVTHVHTSSIRAYSLFIFFFYLYCTAKQTGGSTGMNSLGALGRDHHCTYKSDPFEGKKEEEEEKKGLL